MVHSPSKNPDHSSNQCSDTAVQSSRIGTEIPDNNETAPEPTVELRQKLMVADEVYLYKIPPLQTSGGHRAENWNLASPIATCSLLVERRGDCLVLEFRQKQDDQEQQLPPTTFGKNVASPVFAQAVIDCSVQISSSSGAATELSATQLQHQQQRKIQHWIEGTIDSSRYFTLRISNGGREALIGFGFRDRDQAIDLRESLQHYEASMRREYEASTMNNNDNTASTTSKYTIPRLADGERIHIRTGKSGDNIKSTKSKSKTTDSPTKSDRPILLKKPPPSSSNTSMDEITLQLSNDLSDTCRVTTTTREAQQSHDARAKQAVPANEATDNYDDDDWDTEFVSAS